MFDKDKKQFTINFIIIFGILNLYKYFLALKAWNLFNTKERPLIVFGLQSTFEDRPKVL